MPSAKPNNSNRDEIILTVLSELKVLGVKVPKHKKFNQKTEISKSEKSETDTKCKIFGVPLCDQEWVSDGEFLLPKFLALSTTYLQKYSNKEIGLFRKAGNVARQKKLRIILELGGNLEDCEPNDVASLLKQWLRELPEPLIPLSVQDILVKCLQIELEESRVTACLLACLLLVPDHLHTLKHFLQFLYNIAIDSSKNKMDAYNLAVIMAPNVFTMQESSEKIKGNLVKQHTSLMKTLIENCNKVGEIPVGVSLDKFYTLSELDSSSEILDSTANKSRKKGKTGPVQDIFSGFKKLVGQNGTPNGKLNTPDPDLKASRNRSLSKRKAGSELQSLAAVNKKQACSLDSLDKSLSGTPNQKGVSATSNATGHVRRKSIGALLRRKDKNRKRFKSCKLSQEVSLASSKSPNNTEENRVKNIALDLHNEAANSSETQLQSLSIKKSVSDGQLPPNKTNISDQPTMFTSSSAGCLKDGQRRTSRRNLRSESLRKIHPGEATILDVSLKRNEKGRGTSNRSKESTKDLPEVFANNKENNSDFAGESECKSKVKRSASKAKQDEVGADVSASKRRSPRLSPRPAPTKPNVQNKEVLNSKIAVQSSGMKRQEAFIAKSVTNNCSKIQDFEKGAKKKCSGDFAPRFRDRTSISSKSVRIRNSKQSTPDQKGMKRRTRHGSLIRGRPNSVNNGLQALPSNRLYNNPNVVLNSPSFDLTNKEEMLRYQETRIAESPVLQSLDLSLVSVFQNLALFSPSSFAQADYKQEICLKDLPSISKVVPDDTVQQNAAAMSAKSEDERLVFKLTEIEGDASLITKNIDYVTTPLLKKRKRLSSKSESKIPPTKRRSNPKRGKSFSDKENILNQKITECEAISNLSSTSFNTEKLKSPLNSSLNVSYGSQKMNDSCFKTPVSKTVSPESEKWMSGSTFLSILSPPREEVFNKRESIAMILKNNTGHVQAKVSMYDHGNRSSSKKTDHQDSNLMRTPQTCHSANRNKILNSRNLRSETRGSSSKARTKYQKSPLPPIPKFSLADVNTPSPKAMQPLKEVTNTTPRIDDNKNDSSPKKLKKSISPAFKKGTLKTDPKIRKLKRNSFSGTSPHKMSKRVSRSESSPACRRRIVVANE